MSAKRSAQEKGRATVSLEPKRKKIGIVVVDDHPIVREGLIRVLDQAEDMAVCGQADNIQQALAAIEASKPDLVIVDLSLTVQSGIELIKDIKVRYPQLPVVVHSMYDETMYAERCLRAGAKGYVMKQQPPMVLVQAVRLVLQGEVYLSEAVTKQMLHRLSNGKAVQGGSTPELLSDREFEVLELIGRGHRTSEIAAKLHLSNKTIQTHREHIKEKLNLKDAVSLVRYAVQWVGSHE